MKSVMECGPENCPLTAWAALSPSERKLQRQPLARKLYGQGFSPENIASQFGVDARTIYRDLETFDSVSNVKGDGKDTLGRKKSTGRPKGSKARRKNELPSAELAAKKILDEGKSYGQAEKESGLSNIVLRAAVAREEGRREGRADPEIALADLSITAQQKNEIWRRQEQARLAAQFKQQVLDEVRRRIDEIILPHWKEQIDQAKELYKHRRGAMDKPTFNKIRRALHPDSRNSISDKVLAEAFDTFMSLEKFLLDENDSPTDIGPLPDSLAEWDRMRAAAKASRRRTRNGLSLVL